MKLFKYKTFIVKFFPAYPLNPSFSATIIIAAFIFNLIVFPQHFYPYSLGFVFLFCSIGLIISRQLFLLVYLLLILYFHGAWFIADKNLTDENLTDMYVHQGEGVIIRHQNNRIFMFNNIFYGEDKNPVYVPQAEILPVTELQADYLQNFYLGNRIGIENAVLEITSDNTMLVPEITAKFNNRNFENRYFSRSHLHEYLNARAAYYIPRSAEFYSAALLADKRNLSSEHANNAKELGIFHLYAFSGLHTGLIFGFILLLLRLILLPVKSLFYNDRLYTILLSVSLAVTGLYIDLIGYPVTASRAWLMLAIWLISTRFMGYYKWYATLLHIAGWMLAVSPELLFSYGFILSYLSVAAIMLVIGYRVNLPFKRHFIVRTVTEFAVKTFLVSAAIFLITLPFYLNISELVSLLMPFNNIIHIAVFSLLILPSGLLCSFAGILFYGTSPNMVESYVFRLFENAVDFWRVLIDFNLPFNRFFLINAEFPFVTGYILLYYLMISLPVLYLIRIYHKLNFVQQQDTHQPVNT